MEVVEVVEVMELVYVKRDVMRKVDSMSPSKVLYELLPN